MTTATNPVYARIQKLLALADSARNSSEAEAASAAAKVQDLLQEYGLTLAQVEAEGGSTDQGGGRGTVTTDRRALYRWQRDLMAALAENNFCLHRVREVEALDGKKMRRSRRHQLVGRRLNVDVTLDTYDYLSVAVRRAAVSGGFDHATRESDHHLFLDGAVTRLTERLAERRLQRERESAEREAQRQATVGASGTHRELVLTDVYGSEADQNNDVLNGFPVGTTAAKRREASDRNARQQARHDELVAQGVPDTEAWYQAYGYDPASARQYANSWERKQARSSRGGRGRARSWTSPGGRQYARKISSAAYRAGKVAGGDIGLDDQVGHSAKRRIG